MKQAKPEIVLQKAREAKGYTQDSFANELGISARMYQRYEAGEFPKFKSENIKKIDQALGTNLYDILYDKNVPHGTKIDSDIETQIGDIKAILIRLEASVKIIGTNVSELMAAKRGTSVAKAAQEQEETIRAEVKRVLLELQKKSE